MKNHNVLPFQIELDLDQPTAVQLLASSPAGRIPVLVDEETADRLKGRAISVGSHGYCQIWTEQQRHELLHRWIAGATVRDGRLVDHRNGDPYDCRAANLRFVTHAQNSANRRPTGRAGVLGVFRTPGGKWRAQVGAGKKRIELGTFPELADAARASHEYRLAHVSGYTGRGMTIPSTTARTIAA